MTDRENLIGLLRRTGYERMPLDFTMCPAIRKKLDDYCAATGFVVPPMGYTNLPDSALETVRQPDFWLQFYDRTFREGTTFCQYGVAREPGSAACNHLTYMYHPLDGMTTLEELQAYPFPKYLPGPTPEQLAAVERIHAAGQFAMGNMPCTVWETAWYARGMENIMMDMVAEPELAEFVLDTVTENAVIRAVNYVGNVEEELTQLFPNARVLRMDMDTTMSRDSHEKKFAAFARGDYDIMVGTQMVAKGLNFPNVTLVGVLNADQSLFAQDFRCYENTFSLLTQVIGRCGRGELPGRAYIQTTDPDHYILEQAARQDYEGFYADEIVGRKIGLYPPYCSLCLVGFVSEHPKAVKDAARCLGADFTRRAREEFSELPLRVLEPCVPSLEKIAGKYRYQLVIKCRQGKRFSELMWQTLKAFDSDKQNKEVHVSVDMNYNGSM